MKKWERLAALILAAVGLGAAVQAYLMGFGTISAPGPGFFPFWLSLFLAATSFVHFLGQQGPDEVPVHLWTGRSWLKPALATAVMLVYAFLLGWVGFFPASCLLFVIWLVMEREKLLTIALVATIGTASIYLLFTMLLRVPLPVGKLFR